MVLEVIGRDYTYDPDTGVISKQGKSVGTRRDRDYVRVRVRITFPDCLALECDCKAHLIAWYLTYGEWAPGKVDHIDGDPTNNRLDNLRVATSEQNSHNMRKLTTRQTSSQYKGVSYHKRNGKWIARIVYQGKKRHLGTYTTEEEAARSYDLAAHRLFGRFAKLNFPLLPTKFP